MQQGQEQATDLSNRPAVWCRTCSL